MRIAIEGPALSEVNFNEILDIFKEKIIGALDCNWYILYFMNGHQMVDCPLKQLIFQEKNIESLPVGKLMFRTWLM